MPWLLDTNHWISLLKGRCPPLAARLVSVPPDQAWFCSVVKEELIHGALGYVNPEARLSRLAELFARHASAPLDDAAAESAARIRHTLEARGNIIGPHDLQIAGIGLSRGFTVVTNNTKEFRVQPSGWPETGGLDHNLTGNYRRSALISSSTLLMRSCIWLGL